MEINHLNITPRSDFTAHLDFWADWPAGWAGESLHGLFAEPEPRRLGFLQVTFTPFETNERPEGVRNVVLELDGAEPSQVIATLPWPRLLRAAEAAVMAQRRNTIQSWRDGAEAAARLTGQPIYKQPKARGRKPLGQEHYERIARRYEQLCAAGTRAPVAEIAREESVNANTARAWINRARKKGLLGPASNGKAG